MYNYMNRTPFIFSMQRTLEEFIEDWQSRHDTKTSMRETNLHAAGEHIYYDINSDFEARTATVFS